MLTLDKIEADVVIVIRGNGCGTIIPFWECDQTEESLHNHAIHSCLELNETVGYGITEYTIIDHRK